MPAPFAAIESRVNRAVFARLSNAEGLLDGVLVQGIFHAAYVSAMDVASTGPAFELESRLAGEVRQDASQLILNGVSYSVARIEPDGAGAVVLHLHS